MAKTFRLILFCLITLLITVGSYADDNTEYRELLSKHYQLKMPDGDGPFPSVMMVPGCSGFDTKFQKAFYDSTQNQLMELGFVTLRVNYLAARKFSSCAWNVSTYEVGDDIRIAADYLRQQTFVKKGGY